MTNPAIDCSCTYLNVSTYTQTHGESLIHKHIPENDYNTNDYNINHSYFMSWTGTIICLHIDRYA